MNVTEHYNFKVQGESYTIKNWCIGEIIMIMYNFFMIP